MSFRTKHFISLAAWAALGFSLTGASAQQGAGAAAAPPLAPHRAVYDLSLMKGGTGRGPVAASGRIVYDFSGSSCEGYTVAFRQFTEMTPADGEPSISDMRSTTFESPDRKTMRFRVEHMEEGRVTKRVDGSAIRSGDGALSLQLRQPAPMQADIDHDVVFPTDMTLRTLDAARAGQTILPLKVFDGSDTGDKIYHTMSIIGRPSTAPLVDASKDVPSMKDMRRWSVRVSYFDIDKLDAPPVYILSFQMWDNGISSDLVIDYGDFQLKGSMSKLEMLPVNACRN